MRIVAAGVILAMLAPAGGAMAQVPENPVQEPFRQVSVFAFAGEPTQWPASPPDLIRRAEAVGDPADWLNETDAPIAAWRKTTQSVNLTLILAISAEGRVTGCAPDLRYAARSPEWTAELCPLLARRARLVPALRSDGTRMADHYVFEASFQYSTYRSAQSGPLIQGYGLAPAPSPSSDFDPRLKAWPPSGGWLRRVTTRPVFKLPVEAPGGAPLVGPAIGLIVADPKSGDPECRVVLSSGDAKLDKQACDYAHKKLKPKWDAAVRFPVRRWPLLLSPEGKGFRVIQPDGNAARGIGIDPAELARLMALWQPQAMGTQMVRAGGKIGADGQPEKCRIYDSSGSDAADAAACRLFMTEAKFTAARDVFGQSITGAGWTSLQLRPQ
ncbi:hypothetical protein [Novosphingobium sp.]|uniref:hypothetical protein n=1 Tax=Novosphingobium sp. TaxID=1874826 RepID=UPI00286D3226|nr:hypothetical protein [Novosphingobium sp.]